jgi:hypothetical protein
LVLLSSAAKLFSTGNSCGSRSPFLPTSITDGLPAGTVIAFARNTDRNHAGMVIGIIQEP